MNKLPKGVDQLPSGKYRVRKMINGKRRKIFTRRAMRKWLLSSPILIILRG